MHTTLEGGAAFAYIKAELQPGESIVAESDAMSSMSADLTMKAKFNGFAKGLLGGESFFVNHFTNNTSGARQLTLVQGSPGSIRQVQLQGETICLQPGAYIASTPDVKIGTRWAGIASGFAREGFFKLTASGTGTLWYGAYGGLLERMVDGECIVDTSHLVAYEPQLKLKIQMAGGIFSSLFGGEGFVTRIEGRGKIIIQTRSLDGLANWLNPKL